MDVIIKLSGCDYSSKWRVYCCVALFGARNQDEKPLCKVTLGYLYPNLSSALCIVLRNINTTVLHFKLNQSGKVKRCCWCRVFVYLGHLCVPSSHDGNMSHFTEPFIAVSSSTLQTLDAHSVCRALDDTAMRGERGKRRGEERGGEGRRGESLSMHI